jgi:DUF1009 family protein
MNPLEKIKEQLKLKPTAMEQKQQEVKVVIPTLPEKVNIKNIQFKDEQDKNFPIEALLQNLAERKVGKVVQKATIELQPSTKKPKKLSKKTLLVLEEEGVPIEEPLIKTKPELLEKETMKVEEVKPTEKKAPGEKKRRTSKQPKGISTLDPIEWINIDNVSMVKRFPKKTQNVIYKVSSYYMNNREIFVNFINSKYYDQ